MIWGHSVRMHTNQSPEPPAVNQAMGQAANGAGQAAAAILSQQPGQTVAVTPCQHCGGSGILRMGDQQFRTCLECLGQGQLNRTVQQELLFPSFGLRVSAARAG